MINKLISLHNLDNGTCICTMTANRFDNTQLYSAIIVVGNISGKRFDALRCRSSQEIDLLLYECEKYRYKKQVRDAKAAEHLLNTSLYGRFEQRASKTSATAKIRAASGMASPASWRG